MPTMLDAYQVAEILNISYEKALNFMKAGYIDCFKFGRKYMICEHKLAAFLNKKGFTVVDLG